jgi:hypothetical protein
MPIAWSARLLLVVAGDGADVRDDQEPQVVGDRSWFGASARREALGDILVESGLNEDAGSSHELGAPYIKAEHFASRATRERSPSGEIVYFDGL